MKKKKPVIKLVLADDDINELRQELELRTEDNADLYAKLCNVLLQLEDANKVIKNTANLMVCDPKIMKIIVDPNFRVEQEVLDQCNNYINKWEVK